LHILNIAESGSSALQIRISAIHDAIPHFVQIISANQSLGRSRDLDGMVNAVTSTVWSTPPMTRQVTLQVRSATQSLVAYSSFIRQHQSGF
jgi:hypothetical protein